MASYGSSNQSQDLRSAMASAGLRYDGELIADGKLRRIKVDGDRERNSWYVVFPASTNSPSAAAFGCWKRGVSETWCHRNGDQSPAERKAVQRQWLEAQAAQEKTKVELQAKARRVAQWIFARCEKEIVGHAYTLAKRVKIYGDVRLSYRGELVLPLRDIDGCLHSLQFISSAKKLFLKHARCSGAFFTLSYNPEGPLVICEGYATGATIYDATGFAVVCAMNSGNLCAVAKALRLKHPERELIIAGDDDRATKNNPGATKAAESAKAINGKVAVVQIPDGNAGTDFNDLAAISGIDAVREQILAARAAQKTFAELVEDRRTVLTTEPPPLEVVFALCGTPISTPGNLTSINSHVKSGKSAFEGACISSTFAIAGSDTIGFNSQNTKGYAVVHADTEQSLDDAWHHISRIVKRAGRTEAPPWLRSYCFTGFDAPKAIQAVRMVIERAAQDFGGIHSVHLDGVADLVKDVNDAEECNEFVASLHALAIEYHCPIIGVIHFNPGSDKTRGHLGSQLERKSETNLRLDKDGEVTEVWSEKQRRAPILKGKGPRFAWSDEAGMHVSVESASVARNSEKIEHLRNLRDDVFSGRQAMRYAELENEVQKVTRKSEATAKRILKEWVQNELVTKSVAGLWAPNN